MTDPSDDAATPRTLRWAVWVLGAETVALVGLVVFLLYENLTTPAQTAQGAVAVTLYAAVLAALLALLTWSLWRRRPWARGPAIVLNLLLLPIGYSMIVGGLAWLGVLVGLVGVGGAGLLLAPATRAALLMR